VIDLWERSTRPERGIGTDLEKQKLTNAGQPTPPSLITPPPPATASARPAASLAPRTIPRARHELPFTLPRIGPEPWSNAWDREQATRRRAPPALDIIARDSPHRLSTTIQQPRRYVVRVRLIRTPVLPRFDGPVGHFRPNGRGLFS